MKDLFDSLRRFATREDFEAVDAANKVRFFPSKTGMTREDFKEAFGDFDPDTVARLHVLAGKKHPSNPKEWKALAEEVTATREKIFGEKK